MSAIPTDVRRGRSEWASSPLYALRGVSVDVAGGEWVALLGKSGSGKTMLRNLLGGLDRPTLGGMHVRGLDVGRLSRRELSRFRSATVGMIFQSFNLIPSLSALQNVELPMIFAGRGPRERRSQAEEALRTVGRGVRLILVTHDEELGAVSTSRILRLKDGFLLP